MDFHHAWTPEEDAIALRMRAENCSYRAISDELGRSTYAVRARLRKLESRRKLAE
jgi:DNA-binding Lrp family transcriptional regulator